MLRFSNYVIEGCVAIWAGSSNRPRNHICTPPTAPLSFRDAQRFGYPLSLGQSSARLTDNGWHADLVIDRAKFGFASEIRIGVERVEFLPDGSTKFTNDKPGDYPRVVRLNLGDAQPTTTTPIRLG